MSDVHSANFIEILNKNNIITTSIAAILSFRVNEIVDEFANGFILTHIHANVEDKEKLKKYNFILSIFKFIIIFIFIYIIYKWLKL